MPEETVTTRGTTRLNASRAAQLASATAKPPGASAEPAARASSIAPDKLRALLVGGGIASLAAAAHLIRDGKLAGKNIHVFEESTLGGSLDASGSVETGYSMRGSRMFGAAYTLTYDLLAGIPSLDDPDKSVTQDTHEFWQSAPWDDHARLVENGRVVDAHGFGLRNRDRVDLLKLMLGSEDSLDAQRIDACFEAPFFESLFWLMWGSMFGFQTWHSAVELRRYLLRFLRLFPSLERMDMIHSTRYNGHDSIVRPLLGWLERQGVQFHHGVQVTDLVFAPADGKKAVQRLRCLNKDHKDPGRVRRSDIEVGERDLVIATLGSMTAGSSLGSMNAAPLPALTTAASHAGWALWQRLAEQDPAFGRPSVFCGQPEQTGWVTFTVTHTDDAFARRMERLSGRPSGHGGLVTLKGSRWGLTFHLYHPPAFPGQPAGVQVWWGYGLHPDREGDHVKKAMAACSGREILTEVFSHLGFQEDLPALLATANCIPCLLPYTTSQFMPRSPGDRPAVIPAGTTHFAVIGQYCEIPDDVVFTVEYSVHSARIAVASLLGLPETLPPTYRGVDHPNAMVEAMKLILQ